MRLAITTLLTILLINCAAQKENLLLKFCPLALSDDISFPTIQGGIELKLAGKLTWYNELGIEYRKSYIDLTDTSFVHPAGFKLKSELRYYFQRKYKPRFEGFYYAANVFLTHDKHNTIIYYRAGNDSLRTEGADGFGVKKTVVGFNFPLGYQKRLGRRMMMEFYCGPGIRFRNISTIDKEYNKNTDIIIRAIDINIPTIKREADANNIGTTVLPNLTAGLRICYAF